MTWQMGNNAPSDCNISFLISFFCWKTCGFAVPHPKRVVEKPEPLKHEIYWENSYLTKKLNSLSTDRLASNWSCMEELVSERNMCGCHCGGNQRKRALTTLWALKNAVRTRMLVFNSSKFHFGSEIRISQLWWRCNAKTLNLWKGKTILFTEVISPQIKAWYDWTWTKEPQSLFSWHNSLKLPLAGRMRHGFFWYTFSNNIIIESKGLTLSVRNEKIQCTVEILQSSATV